MTKSRKELEKEVEQLKEHLLQVYQAVTEIKQANGEEFVILGLPNKDGFSYDEYPQPDPIKLDR